MTKLRKILISTLVAIGLVAGGYVVAQASIPHSTTGVITGCYKSSGDLRVIDAQAGATCAGNETQLTWNQMGPAGPTCTPGPWVELTLNPDYGNFGGGNQPASIRHECTDTVRVVGLLIGPTGVIATVPAEFCPDFSHTLNDDLGEASVVIGNDCNLSVGNPTSPTGMSLEGTYPLS